MPVGYEKMRDSFIRQGLSEEDAKEKAARIWNSKHKGDQAVGRHYDNKTIMSNTLQPGASMSLERRGSGLSLHGIQDTTLLGVGDFAEKEDLLRRRLQQLSGRKPFTANPIPPTAEEIAARGSQHRAPLANPLRMNQKEPSMAEEAQDYLARLRKAIPLKKKRPGTKGFFPERGDIRDF